MLNVTVTSNSTDSAMAALLMGAAAHLDAKNVIWAQCLSRELHTNLAERNLLGNNLDSDGTCGLTGSGDLNVDPLLKPLAENGDPTQTHNIPGGSPAIDAAIIQIAPANEPARILPPLGCQWRWRCNL